MNSRRILALVPSITLGVSATLLGYSRGPLPALTGGFKEGTCMMCHTGFELNEGRTRGGIFQIDGAPKTYESGKTYPVMVVIGQPGQKRWGFELSARFADSGDQAGRLVPVDGMTQVIEREGIQYIEHTIQGTRAGTLNGTVTFQFNWIAPDPAGGMVLFNAAGNAANFSETPAGDYIYTAGAWSGSSPGEPLMTVAGTPRSERQWGERISDSSKVVDLPAPSNLRRGTFEFHIQHRFFESLADSRPGDAFGVDSGADINLGLNYGITDRMSLGVSRARDDSVIAWTGTFEINTREDSFWKMSLLAGVEGQSNFERQYSPNLQLTTRFDYKGVRLYVVPTAVFHSRDIQLVNQNRARAINPDSNNTFSMGLGGDVAINSRFSVVGEIIPRLAGFGGFDHHRPTVSGGVEIRTAAHVFTFLVSSSRDFTPAKYAVNPEESGVSLGFNIYRRMR